MSRRTYQIQKDSMAEYINPANGYRGNLSKKGIQPKDHMKDNANQIRMTQMKLRMKKDEDSMPGKPLYKLAQFQNVAPRLYEEKENNNSGRRASFDTGDREFLTRGQAEKRRQDLTLERKAIRSEMERKFEDENNYNEKPLTPRKPSVPRADEIARLDHQDVDFINRNRISALSLKPKKNDSSELPSKHEEYGKVPQYLENRKAQWEEEKEEMRRRMPDPNCPPGMRLMPEHERLDTLRILQESKEEALSQIRKLPFVIETPSQKKKQEFLESKLREIDNALSIFSKPKVFVALDR